MQNITQKIAKNDRATAVAAGLIFLTESQLAERWQVSVKKLQADRGNRCGVPFVKIGRSVRYRLAEVLAFEELHMFLPTGAVH
ncbi:hypothetical protein [Aestuariivirga sp.]|uniref:hypothetical protein n=1 Tax=Aestuariivirga sp. TaxID=2650926 RepID=UPI003BA89C44